MAKSFVCRVALAQISFNPAYADELVASIQEPFFPPENEKIGLFAIAGLEEIGRLRQRIAEQYVAHLNRKIEAVVRFAAKERVDLLVFPEYSIPPESLPLCDALSEELGMAIIAGSHVVTLSEAAQQVYRDLELTFPDTQKPAEEQVRQAVCVVFVPAKKPVAFTKYVRSKWETCLVKGSPAFHSFDMSIKAGRVEVQVLICLEALSDRTTKAKRGSPRLIVVPAFTPKAEPFYGEARGELLQGKCTLFANVAEFGGSRLFARADNASLWFTEQDGTKAVPKGSEALLVMEADLEKQFEIRKSTEESTAVTDVRLYPLLYTMDSVEAQQYSNYRDVCAAVGPKLLEISTQVASFTSLTPKVFPKLLQEKLAHFTGHIAPAGTISSEDAIGWITPVVIPDTPSTDLLRWELCKQSMETVNGLLASGKYLHKAVEISQVYINLLSRQGELSTLIQPKSAPAADKSEVAARPANTRSPFIDRDSAFDKIRRFFNQQQSSAFVLGGMRGIGKSALVEEAFRQAIPPRRRVWLQMTEGISYERLLAELAYGCNLRIPDNLKLADSTVRSEIKKRILSYLGQGPGTVVVFDDFHFLLNSSGEIENAAVRDLLVGLLETGHIGRAKFFLISHISPRLGPMLENLCLFYVLQGLEPRDTERLLVQWLQFGRDDLAGQLPSPSDRLVSVLGGHPLATRIAARLWAEHPTADISQDFSIFRKFRDSIVSFILEKLTLSQAEKNLLAFASIFRLAVSREVFLQWRKEDASYLLSSLAGQFLIESSDKGYQLHPLIRSYFSNGLSIEEAKTFHKIAAKFYLQEFNSLKDRSKQIVPEYLGESVHHFLAAGDRQTVKGLAFYSQELRPVAWEHFKRQDLDTALKDYKVLLELDTADVDAHFHLSLIYARKSQWGDAEFHFGRAIDLKPKAYWILQGYGAAKIRGNKVAEGEALLLEAEQINPKHCPTLLELGSLQEKRGDPAGAEDYYRRAIEADPNSGFAYFRLARLLYHEGDITNAYEMAMAALECNPVDPRNKALVADLKKKLSDQ